MAFLACGWAQPVPDDDPCVVAQLEAPEPCAEAVPVYRIAGIVAGEVSVVPQARLAVACTALRDWRIGRPLGPPRWNGWALPRAADYAAVEMALDGACTCYPYFRFVGNGRDWQTWTRLGWVAGDPPWEWRNGRWMVVATE